MKLSRRDALRAGGAVLVGGSLSGCIEERVTSRETRVETSTTWALNPTVRLSVDQASFEQYTTEMADQYGDSGVWGLEAERDGTFETAYVQRLAMSRETPAQPGGGESSLNPDEVDPDAPILFADAAVAVYEVGDGRYRYWLWTAADGNDSRLVRDVEVSILSASVSFRQGIVADVATIDQSGDEAAVSLGSPPSGRFPLRETTSNVEANSERGEDGYYSVDWSGNVDGAQSINGVCEEERSGDHDFFWAIAAGYTLEQQV